MGEELMENLHEILQSFKAKLYLFIYCKLLSICTIASDWLT